MSPTSPTATNVSLVSFSIKVEGKPIDSTYQVVSIDTWVAVNRVPKAQLIIYDGSAAEGTFPISSAEVFLPGKKVEISAGYNGKDTLIFRGVVVKQGIEIDQVSASRLVVDITDEAIKMTLERKNAIFEKVKDSALIEKLISNSGLKKKVTATTMVYEEIIQYYATDWDMMLTRAELNGFVVIVENGTVMVQKPDTQQAAALSVKYGDTILDLQAELDASTQYSQSAIKSYTWDPATQKLIEAGPSAVNVKEQGNVSSDQLAQVFKVKKFTQQTGGALEKGALADWSSAELLKSRLSKIRGNVRFQGSAKAVTGKTIDLGGLGTRFNGTAFISGVHHSITDGQWLTTVEFGLSSQWFAEETQLAAPNAAGQLPPVKGLQTGVVKKVAQDPSGEYRVQISLPLLQDASKGVWARLGGFYASNKVGAVFFPEVNDEVIVGFMNEDPRFPIILGSVYSKKLAPPVPPDDKNNKKVIVTRSKLQITFDDENKILQINTPGKHTIKLDDTSGAISIQDSNRNTLSLSKGGITLDSASNLTIKAKGNVTVQAGGNLGLKATANATLEGLQVANKAKAKFSANGAATAEVTSSGMLTIRGTLVKIN